MTIEADFQTLVNIAPVTIGKYMWEAIDYIDTSFGKGYAAKNPQLVAAFIQACNHDFIAAAFLKEVGEIVSDFRSSIVEVIEDFKD